MKEFKEALIQTIHKNGALEKSKVLILPFLATKTNGNTNYSKQMAATSSEPASATTEHNDFLLSSPQNPNISTAPHFHEHPKVR